MTKVLTTRVDQNLASRIQKAAKELHIDKAAFMRTLIANGLSEVEQEIVLKRYQNEKISLGKMADLLHITKLDAIYLLQAKSVHLNYSEEQLREDTEGF